MSFRFKKVNFTKMLLMRNVCFRKRLFAILFSHEHLFEEIHFSNLKIKNFKKNA